VQLGLGQSLSDWLRKFQQARSLGQKASHLANLRLGDLRLHIPSVTNRTTGKSMGEHTEITAGKEFAYRMKVLRGEDFAYLIAAWVNQEDPDREKIFSRCNVARGTGHPEDRAGCRNVKRAGESAASGWLSTVSGWFYFNEQRFEQSAPFFKKAVDLDGLQTNTPYLQNFTEACIRTGAYRMALDELERHPAFVESHNELTASHAFLMGQLGQMDEGNLELFEIFAADIVRRCTSGTTSHCSPGRSSRREP